MSGSPRTWSFAHLRFPVVLIAIVLMLLSMEETIDRVADGVGRPLFLSARLEETSKMDIEATRLFDLADAYARGRGDVAHSDVVTALDLLWSRVSVGRSKSYRDVLDEADFDTTLIPELAEALPAFDAAVAALRQGDPASLAPLADLKDRFALRLHDMGETAWAVRQRRLAEQVENNLQNVSLLRDTQVGFVVIAVLSLAYVLYELTATRRLNGRLNALVAEKQRLLRTDPLTGIANRPQFEERLALLMAGTPRAFSLAYIDLDGFKAVNDTLGHAAGDQLLCTVAAVLSDLTGPGDTVARFGGDEFALLLAGEAGRGEALMQEACARIRAIQPRGEAGPRVGASIGLCHGADLLAEEAADAAMRYSDLALYDAKQAGRDRVVVFSRSMLARRTANDLEETLLPAAIATGRTDAAFQPFFRVADGEVAGLEALVRWSDPRLGVVPADRIVDIAERTGQITALTHTMIDRSIALRERLVAAGIDLPIAVNLSPTLVARPGFGEDVTRRIAAAGVPADRIVFEVTEYANIEEGADTLENLRTLVMAGVPIAVDDFGRAYSSVQRLMALDFRYLKLDRKLMENVASSPRALAILTGVNNLAGAVGAAVIAEGIETPDQLEMVRRAGIAFAQGFHLARPMSGEDAVALLARRRSGLAGGSAA